MSMYLGSSDMDVSRIGLGCMRMAELPDSEVERVVGSALDNGITLFDHADIYGGGASEEKFGRLLAGSRGLRDKMRIQSKCGICEGYYDLSAKHIIEAVEGSLKRLRTDYLDLLLLHRPDALMVPDEIADAFSSLEQSGKVLAFGVSNFNTMQISMLQSELSQPLVANQLQFGLGHTQMISSGICTNTGLLGAVDRDGYVLDYCRMRDITVQAWSPLQYGLFEGTIFDKEKFPKLNEVLSAFARRYDVTEAMIAIAWILKHPANMQVLIGTMKPEHIRDLCRADGLELTRQEWYELYLAAGNDLP
ncbi:MAG: aldo/keto reductase [Lachnospiraceae bacterium]|nr:aldo/keto reductase [Lachnospiraceae bacterium]